MLKSNRLKSFCLAIAGVLASAPICPGRIAWTTSPYPG